MEEPVEIAYDSAFGDGLTVVGADVVAGIANEVLEDADGVVVITPGMCEYLGIQAVVFFGFQLVNLFYAKLRRVMRDYTRFFPIGKK